MPVPKQETIASCKDRSEANELLAQFNWYPELTFEWLEYNPLTNRCVVKTFYIDGTLFPCRSGERYTYFTKERTGIIMLDLKNYNVSGLVDMDSFRTLGERVVTLDEGLEFCEKNNQRLPIALHNHKKKKKAVIIW